MPSTPLSPDDGEANDASVLPAGFGLDDAEQIAAQRLDAAAEGWPTEPTPLPPSDGENGHVSALQTSLRLSDAEQIAAQRLDGVDETSPTQPILPPPSDGETNHASGPPTNLRLSDAEQVALQRLDGAAEGSLREALAIAPAGDVADSVQSLVERVQAIGEGLVAEPLSRFVDATPTAELSDAQPTNAHAPELSTAFAVEADATALPVEALEEAAVEGGSAGTPTPDMQEPTGAAAPLDAGVPGAVHPLASALDAATKLAADASAAADALESLKRLLERQRRPPDAAASPAPAAAEVDAEAAAGPPTVAAAPPLPLHAVRNASGHSTLRPALLAPPPASPRRIQADRTRLDVRGFLAGFALSWAFGVVLYLFMSAG